MAEEMGRLQVYWRRRRSMLASLTLGILATSVQPGFAGSALPKNQVIATVTVGTLPAVIAVSSDNGGVYVANQVSDSVSVINPKDNYAVTATITNLSGAFGVAVSPDSKSIYVTNGIEPGLVYAIDTTRSTYPITATISVGANPQGLALSPNGKQLYVANFGNSSEPTGGTVSVIDLATDQVTATISSEGNPMLVSFTKSGDQADLLNFAGNGFLQFVNTASGTISQSIGAGEAVFLPAGMAVDRSGGILYISNLANSVAQVRADNGALIKEILAVPNQFDWMLLGQPAVTLDGKYLYVGYLEYPGGVGNQIVMIDINTGQIVGQPITVGVYPGWILISPEGGTLYVANEIDGTVSVLDIKP